MQKLYKTIVWFEVAIFLLTLELISYYHYLIPWLVPLFFVVFLLGLWWLNGKRLNKRFFNTMISPFLFVLGAVLFYIFLVPQVNWFKHLYIIFVSGLLLVFLYNLNELLFRPSIRRLFALENLSSHFNLLAVFLLFSSFYTFMFFPTLIFWLTEVLVIVVVILLMYHNFWSNKIVDPKRRFFILVTALVMAQTYLVLSFLPTGFYVNGIILTVLYYLMSEISRVYLLEKLTAKFVRTKLVISVVILVLIFLTTRWS